MLLFLLYSQSNTRNQSLARFSSTQLTASLDSPSWPEHTLGPTLAEHVFVAAISACI